MYSYFSRIPKKKKMPAVFLVVRSPLQHTVQYVSSRCPETVIVPGNATVRTNRHKCVGLELCYLYLRERERERQVMEYWTPQPLC